MNTDTTIRNARSAAPLTAMDLTRPDEEIQRELRAKYPRVIDLNWELDDDEKGGWVYSGVRILTRLFHVATLPT